jgi:transcriptional repressor NrdR
MNSIDPLLKEKHIGNLKTLLKIYWSNKPMYKSQYFWIAICTSVLSILIVQFLQISQVEILELMVVKRDGSKESYSREKLVKGLRRSLEKRPITDDKFKILIHSIERDIQRIRKSEVTTSQVGQIIMKYLKKVDQVAYIRFASVYESFKDAQEFRRELNKLLKIKNKKK